VVPGDAHCVATRVYLERVAAAIAVKSRAEREISREIEPGE
jgi:hypothetical protein